MTQTRVRGERRNDRKIFVCMSNRLWKRNEQYKSRIRAMSVGWMGGIVANANTSNYRTYSRYGGRRARASRWKLFLKTRKRVNVSYGFRRCPFSVDDVRDRRWTPRETPVYTVLKTRIIECDESPVRYVPRRRTTTRAICFSRKRDRCVVATDAVSAKTREPSGARKTSRARRKYRRTGRGR